MNWDVFITCALTGAGETAGKSPHVPVTPQQIAESAIDAAKAGAAVVTSTSATRTGVGAGPRRLRRGRRADPRLGRRRRRQPHRRDGRRSRARRGRGPLPPATDGTDMAGATERLDHVRTSPGICTSTAAR